MNQSNLDYRFICSVWCFWWLEEWKHTCTQTHTQNLRIHKEGKSHFSCALILVDCSIFLLCVSLILSANYYFHLLLHFGLSINPSHYALSWWQEERLLLTTMSKHTSDQFSLLSLYPIIKGILDQWNFKLPSADTYTVCVWVYHCVCWVEKWKEELHDHVVRESRSEKSGTGQEMGRDQSDISSSHEKSFLLLLNSWLVPWQYRVVVFESGVFCFVFACHACCRCILELACNYFPPLYSCEEKFTLREPMPAPTVVPQNLLTRQESVANTSCLPFGSASIHVVVWAKTRS